MLKARLHVTELIVMLKVGYRQTFYYVVIVFNNHDKSLFNIQTTDSSLGHFLSNINPLNTLTLYY